MISFFDADKADHAHLRLLYLLLAERRPEESISHVCLPSWADHVNFVQSSPYATWLLAYDGACVGTGYVTRRGEIGVTVFKEHKRKGYGREIVRKLMRDHGGQYANINPMNKASIALFESLGFSHVQSTYRHD